MFTGVFIDSFALSPYLEGAESELVWSIAAPAPYTSPNILSELSYTELKREGLGFQFSYLKTFDNLWAFYAEGDYSNTAITSGESQDSDYFSDNRTDEFSRSYSDVSDELVERKSLALGVKTRWTKGQNEGHYVTVLLGYQEHDVDMTVTNGVQVVPVELNGDSIVGLNSTYNSDFTSLYLGLSTEHVFNWGIVGFRYERHDLDFVAEADWNLRDDFQHPKSFEHTGDGDGDVFTLGYTYKLNFHFDVFVNVIHREYVIKNGNDEVFFSDGTTGETKLNKLFYKSNNIRAGIRFVF